MILGNYFYKYDYRTSHNYYFSSKNMDLLIKKVGLKIEKKIGFNPPLDNIIQQFSKNELMNMFENSKLFDYLDKNHCYEILDNHFDKRNNNTMKIYQLLFLSKWITANS